MSCAPPPALEGFQLAEATVGDHVLTVAYASTPNQRRQGLREVAELPSSIDGMIFVWDEPTNTSFDMRDVSFPLDVWFFDADGRLIGSARMETCGEDGCTSYATPGPVMWAVETPAGEWEFAPGALLSNVESG